MYGTTLTPKMYHNFLLLNKVSQMNKKNGNTSLTSILHLNLYKHSQIYLNPTAGFTDNVGIPDIFVSICINLGVKWV